MLEPLRAFLPIISSPISFSILESQVQDNVRFRRGVLAFVSGGSSVRLVNRDGDRAIMTRVVAYGVSAMDEVDEYLLHLIEVVRAFSEAPSVDKFERA